MTFFLIAFFITDFFYNNNKAKYVYVFNSNAENISEIITVEYFDSVIKQIDEYNKTAEKKISYAKIEYQDMLKNFELNQIGNTYEFIFLKKYFETTVKESNGQVNISENRAIKYLNLIFSYSDKNIEFVELKLINYVNPFIVGGIAAGASVVIIVGYIIFLYLLKGLYISNIEDNIEIFTSIFHKAYWKNSLDFTKKVKDLCTISILFTMMLICKFIPFLSGFGALKIGLGYLFFSVICLIYGPVCGIFIGFCSDILGYFLFQSSAIFFLGYTLSAMLTGFIYGVFFHKKKITFTNCLLARFFVNIFINVVLGSIWWAIIYNLDAEAIKTYVLLTTLPKNVLYLLPQSILLYIALRALAKPLAKFGLINNKIAENVELF